MNKQRREAIVNIIKKINQDKDELQLILNEEQGAFVNLNFKL